MDNYSLFKHVCSDNAYSSLCKTLNSAYCSFETQKTIKRITKEEICYAHMGQLIIEDGVCYTTYLQNPGTDGESGNSKTSGVVLAVFDLARATADDFDPEKDVTVYPIGMQGGMCAGYCAASIFKDNSMCLVGREIFVCFSFITADGQARMFCKAFDIDTHEWTRENELLLRYKGKDYVFSDVSLNEIYGDKGVAQNAKGLIELVSCWSEYKGEYYATGIPMDIPNNGFVVKTKDFHTMDLVDVVPFNDRGASEISSCVFRGKLYVACRQDYTLPYLYLSALDLETMKWDSHYKLPDGNCRPWFFVYREELYLLNTVEERTRRYTNISRVRTWDTEWKFFNGVHPVEVMATIKGCGSYFATASYEGEIYFVSTMNTESFGKLCLHFYSEDEVNEKLLALLG